MKNSLKILTVLLAFSLITASVGTFAVYQFFPQYLCYAVYDVHESNLDQRQDKAVEPGSRFSEYFTPQNSYLKSMVFNAGRIVSQEEQEADDANGNLGDFVDGKLLDSSGKILAESKIMLTDIRENTFCTFNFETWVDTGQQYELSIVFPDSQDLMITFGSEDSGPSEHNVLMINGAESKDNLYLQYVYGSYSKKLLLFWFLIFFLSAYLAGEKFINDTKLKI